MTLGNYNFINLLCNTKYFYMSQKEHIEAIKEIRQMMNKSARFLSLSGLSGIFAGSYALIAAYIAYDRLGGIDEYANLAEDKYFYVGLATLTLVLAFITAYLFTRLKANKNRVKMWDETVKIAMINLGIPLVAGGVFCLSLLSQGLVVYLAPVTLIFYGLALVSVSRHTYFFIRQLGLLEIVLGLINAFYLGYGIIFWVIGFGLLHIAYGIFMYYKFDRQ